ncbi:hypothetical protein OG806_42675 [Streptomyces sp. NBC_00882]|uniref:hypothetical protein n=1 Tax=Streptomyces sp. NBC_00882 TaxID=2975856 RepID=UPI003864B8FD|nr:hypothetical protein OG806_42675 [Streptomyces sp. NBC_00882]
MQGAAVLGEVRDGAGQRGRRVQDVRQAVGRGTRFEAFGSGAGLQGGTATYAPSRAAVAALPARCGTLPTANAPGREVCREPSASGPRVLVSKARSSRSAAAAHGEPFSAGSVEPGRWSKPIGWTARRSYGTPTTAANSDREQVELAEGIV